MKTITTLCFCIFFCALNFVSKSQRVESIKFKKDPSLIYFFLKGKKSDTLNITADNFFYLVIPDTLKKSLSIIVDNGQLMSTPNDSLVKLNYLPGFQYESVYVTKENPLGKNVRPLYEFNTLVNGTSILKEGKISITLINKQTGGLILENIFIYKNN